jgi:glycine/D-amino acid oxidase-like deaminating enzyme
VKTLRIEPRSRLGLPGEPYAWQDQSFSGVETNKGFVKADSIFLATGSRTSTLLDPLGVDCLSKPKKRMIFRLRGEPLNRLLQTKGFSDLKVMPFTFLPKIRGFEVWVRPAPGEKSFWIGASDDVGRRYMFEDEPAADETHYTYNISPILAEYFPCFANLRPVNSWAGHYDINALDGTPIVDQVSNCIFATGTSGSGIMKADAMGRIAAALFQGKTETTLYGNRTISTSRISLQNRAVDREEFVI